MPFFAGMHNAQAQVKEFMIKARQATPDRPTMPDFKVRLGRLKWLAEELCELATAWGIEFDLNNRGATRDNFVAWPREKPPFDSQSDEALTEAYDATLDLLVFAIGNGVAMGTELEPGWQEVHRSNMSKFIDGYIRSDGKWMKGPSYSRPNLAPILAAQRATALERDRQKLLKVPA